MTYEGLLNDSIRFQTKASSQNDLGEWTYSWTTGSTGVICRMSPLSAMERLDQTGRYDDVSYKCFCESSAAIIRGDRAVWNSDTYRIKEVILDSSKHHKTGYLVIL